MKKILFVLTFSLFALPAFAKEVPCSVTTRQNIEEALGGDLKLHAIEKLQLIETLAGSCDGDTCNPDSYVIYVKVKNMDTVSDRRFVVVANGPARKTSACTITDLKELSL